MNLKAIRVSRGVTQAKLADALSVQRTTVTMWETGKSSPSPEMLVRIASYFGVTVDEILGRDVPDTDVGEMQAKKEPAADDSGLEEYKKQLIDALSSASPDDIRRMLEIARLVMGNRPV